MDALTITGGSGLLGRALLARLHDQADVTVVSRSEKAQLPLRAAYPDVRFVLGDVRDETLLRSIFRGQDAVIHAAALKHVDLSEAQSTEYASVNVGGTIAVVRAAQATGVRRVVGISTDKACVPQNVYGLTKLVMERVLREHGYVAVRYGNVFASDGSVVDRWRRLAASNGQPLVLHVTDPLMTRFWFHIDHAVDTVLWTLGYADPGVVVVPRLRSATLGSLAAAFLVHHGSGRWETVGMRLGEKRHEALVSPDECWVASDDGKHILLNYHKGRHDPTVAPLTSENADRISEQELVSWLA